MPGTLFVVATPLGNLEDLSPRAARTLGEVDLIACEDTRHTQKLLNHFGIRTATISYHEHNEETRAAELLNRLKEGTNIAIVSDAGTPLISDPGFRLVAACRNNAVPVIPVPGPSALTAAVSVCGLPTDRFLFLGFLPRRAAARREEIKRFAEINVSLVIYAAPHNLRETLLLIRETLGSRALFVIREITKLYESSHFGSIEDVIAATTNEPARGEYTLVVGPGEGQPGGVGATAAQIDALAYVEGLIGARGLSRKDAVRIAADQLGLNKRELYALATKS